MVDRLRDTNAFLTMNNPASELTLVSENSKESAGGYRRKSGQRKSFKAQLTVEQLQHSQKVMLGQVKIQRREAGRPEKDSGRHLERNILEGLGKNLCVLADADRVLWISTEAEGLNTYEPKTGIASIDRRDVWPSLRLREDS